MKHSAKRTPRLGSTNVELGSVGLTVLWFSSTFSFNGLLLFFSTSGSGPPRLLLLLRREGGRIVGRIMVGKQWLGLVVVVAMAEEDAFLVDDLEGGLCVDYTDAGIVVDAIAWWLIAGYPQLNQEMQLFDESRFSSIPRPKYIIPNSVESQWDDHSDDVPSETPEPRKEVIDDEIGSIMENNTWVLSDLPPGCKPLGFKWIFKRKMQVDGTIDKFKARLVIQGFRQKEGIHYFDTYASVACITTIRLLLDLAAIHNLVIHQMDVKTTFLNGDLEEEVHMKQPKGFVMPDTEHKVLIMKYLVNISKRRAFWSLNEDILKINDSDNQYAISNHGRYGVYVPALTKDHKEDQYACMTRSSTSELFTPYKEPEREFRSSRRHFKTLSLDELRSPDFNLLSDQEYSEEEVAETMAKTMEQYMSKTRADYGSGVARPKIEDKDNFELKGQFLKELRTNTFSGSDHEDANKHIEKVLEIVDLFHIPNITIDQVMLRAFLIVLTGPDKRGKSCSINELGIPTRQILDSRGAIPSKTTADAKVAIQEWLNTLRNGTIEHLARLMGETLVLNRSLEPFFEDYIELNDLNEPFELRRNQGDDLIPTIEEGEVIEEFKTRDDELDDGIDDYPSYCDYDKNIHIDFLENMDNYRDEGMGDVIFGEPFLRDVGIKTRRFEGMITISNVSFNDEEEYVAIKEDEYNDLTITSEEACRAYQEIFRMMDEGWKDLRSKEISTNIGGESTNLEILKKWISTKRTENQAKITKLIMEWKRLCKIKAKSKKTKSESLQKNHSQTVAGTERILMNAILTTSEWAESQ
ncbi:zinc finger, CCHC-type containing protein [Tanacetum coccineum]